MNESKGRNFDLTKMMALPDDKFQLVVNMVNNLYREMTGDAPTVGPLKESPIPRLIYTLPQEKKDFMIGVLAAMREEDTTVGDISDGYHTFNDLYKHRTVLFAALCNQAQKSVNRVYRDGGYVMAKPWKSRKHYDPDLPMFPGMFIAGITLLGSGAGQVTYHIDDEYWDLFHVEELDMAPAFDGHTPDTVIDRIRQHYCE